MELESLKCIGSRLERVVVVTPTYVLFSLETQYPGDILKNIYDVGPIGKFSSRERVIRNNNVGDFKYLVDGNKSKYFGRVSKEDFN